MSHKLHLTFDGLDDTDFFRAITSGVENTEAEWYDYVDRYHSAIPTATEALFLALCTSEGHSSYELLARAIAKERGQDILEIGCGSGQLVHALTASPDLHYTGIDLCRTEIERGLAAFEGYENVRFVHARAAQLPFDDESFDVVTSHQTFNFMPDPVPAFAEAYRVLRPGGALVFAVNRATRLTPSATFQRLFKAAAGVMRSAYPQYAIPRDHDPRIYQDGGILSLLNEAGWVGTEHAKIETFDVGAMMNPEEAYATIVRGYELAAVPSKDAMLDAVEALAREIAAETKHDDVDLELGIRIVTARRSYLSIITGSTDSTCESRSAS
jgi:ubiquinone/menaquinone biosynthesis C-methylase UbiE